MPRNGPTRGRNQSFDLCFLFSILLFVLIMQARISQRPHCSHIFKLLYICCAAYADSTSMHTHQQVCILVEQVCILVDTLVTPRMRTPASMQTCQRVCGPISFRPNNSCLLYKISIQTHLLISYYCHMN